MWVTREFFTDSLVERANLYGPELGRSQIN